MNKKSLAWGLMTFFAVGVAGYAAALVLAPGMRHPLVNAHFEARPLFAYGHFLGGAVALAVGAFQLNARLRTGFIAVHRWLGRIYLLAIAVGGVSSLVMAPNSTGGLVANVGFGLLGVVWLATTFNAYRWIRERKVDAHRAWMIRSYALTLAAVTLRIYLPASQAAGLSMAVAYPVIAWLCWVPNLLIAEWFIRAERSFPVRGAARRVTPQTAL